MSQNNQSPFYRPTFVFKSGTKGPITILLSDKPSDWGTFTNIQAARQYVNTFMQFCTLWCRAHGYSSTSFRYVPSWDNTRTGKFDWNIKNEEQLVREACLSDFLSPQNYNLPMLQWRGLGSEPKTRDLSWIDYGTKTE